VGNEDAVVDDVIADTELDIGEAVKIVRQLLGR